MATFSNSLGIEEVEPMRQEGIDFTLRTNNVNYVLDGNTMMFFLGFKLQSFIQNVLPNSILKMRFPKINGNEGNQNHMVLVFFFSLLIR